MEAGRRCIIIGMVYKVSGEDSNIRARWRICRGQQRWIRQRRRCGTATDEMWDDGDREMGWKDGNRLRKYQQGTTTNLRVYRHSGIMGMADKVSNEDIVGQAWWRRCGTTERDTMAEEMRDGNRIDVGRRRWRNGLEGR